MPTIEEVLDSIKDEAAAAAKGEFKALLDESKSDSQEFVKETGKKVESWLILRAQGQIDDDELEALVRARKRRGQQLLNTLEIKARARVERLSMRLFDIVTDTFLGLL